MALKRDYCIAFINSLDNIDPEDYVLVQNLMHYWVKELQGSVKVKVFTYYESALIFGRDFGYEHLIIIDIGNDLEVNGKFIEELDKFLKDDVLAGHILDKGNRYYELHNQCFYINTRIWKELGSPEIGHSKNSAECIVPVRSEENHHDDYTPYWIKSSKETKVYENLKFGHNLIHEFLKAGYTIRSFNDSVRKSKFYGYPRDKNKKISNIYNLNFQKKFYMFNTETVPYNKLPNNISKLATVSAGLNHLKILYKQGYTSDIEICFFDWDEFSLKVMEEIYTNWDGYNYPDFLLNICDKLKYDGKLVSTDNSKWQEFINFFETEENFVNWFTNFKNSVKVKYLKIDILKDDISSITSFLNNKDNNLLWLSNIFHYKPTSLLYNTAYRADIQDKLVKQLSDNVTVYADSAMLGQPKIFTKETYIPQAKSACKFIEENLN